MVLKLLVIAPLGLIGAGVWLIYGPGWSMIAVGGLTWADLYLMRRPKQ